MNSLKNKIYKDNIEVENCLYYEEIIEQFLSENKLKFDNLYFFKEKVNENDLFTIVYDYFKTLDKDIFSQFYSLFLDRTKNIIFTSKCILKDYVGITYESKEDIIIKMKRQKTIEDIFTLVHEYGHAIILKNHPEYMQNYAKDHFSEIESIFLELLLYDYLESINFNNDDIKTMKNIFVKDLNNNISELDIKYKINRLFHIYSAKCVNKEIIKYILDRFNISKEKLSSIYFSPFSLQIKYVLGSLYSFELYDIYKYNKDKAFEDYKYITNLNLPTHTDYIDAIESKLIVPNESDSFIRTLKK